MKPAVEVLEQREVMSIVVGGGVGGIVGGGGSGGLQIAGQPQPLSNLSSVTDYAGQTYFFQINTDHTVSFTTRSAPSGVWQNTGVQAISISAGTDLFGNAVVGIIKPDQYAWVFDTNSLSDTNGSLTGSFGAFWTNLNGKALSISATQGQEDISGSGLVYVIGTNYNLYVQDAFGHGWIGLGTPALSNGQHVPLDTISALSYSISGYPGGASVCYATDNVGEVWQFTLKDAYHPQDGGTWTSLGGPSAVQIAAGFDANGNPLVYALSYNQFNNVYVYDGGWTSLGGNALEISAPRSFAGPGGESRNTVYAIMDSHQVSVLDNSAYTDWTHVNTSTGPTWQSLGGYATAITAEAVELGRSSIFVEGTNNDAYIYNNGWSNLLGVQMNPSYTPLNY